jgi:DNA-binding winged helix-turn-helix (wHTH) protein
MPQIKILGTVEVTGFTEGLCLTRQQARLLGLLAINANRMVPTEQIAVAMSGGPPAARQTAQMAVARLRRVLGKGAETAVMTVSGGYELVVDPERVDLFRAVDRLRSAVAAGAVAAIEVDDHLRLWQETVFGVHATALLRDQAITRINSILTSCDRHRRPIVIG